MFFFESFPAQLCLTFVFKVERLIAAVVTIEFFVTKGHLWDFNGNVSLYRVKADKIGESVSTSCLLFV